MRFGKTEEAVDNLRKAVELDANFTEAHALLAEIYMRQERYAEAIPAFERVLALKAEDDATLYNLGFACWKAGHLDDGAEALQRAIKLRPDNAQLYELLSHVYIRSEKYNAAKDTLNTLLILRPDDASAYQRLAGVHFMLKQPDEGIAAMREVIRLRPRDAEAHKTLGYQLMTLGRNNEAEEVLRQSLALNPEDKDVRDTLKSAADRQAITPEMAKLQIDILST